MSFLEEQKQQHIAYFKAPRFAGKLTTGQPFLLLKEHRLENLNPAIRDEVGALFEHSDPRQRIQWHRYIGHGCSSQACCVNFLYPLAQTPSLLKRWVEHITGLQGLELIPIEERHGAGQLVAFEWFPETDYLNESTGGLRSRGANSTSVDAAIKYLYQGEVRLLLVEWKYTESYPAKRSEDHREGDRTRDRRYHNIWRRPHGPLRQDCELSLRELYLEPWYQLLRQQSLAYHTELDPLSGYQHVTVAHISPRQNKALRVIRGEPFMKLAAQHKSSDCFELFSSLIAEDWRDRFTSWSTEEAFKPLAAEPQMSWLKERYPSLF